MKSVVIGAHLRREDVEPLAVALPARDLFLSALEIHDDQQLGDRDLLVRVARLRAELLTRATFVAVRYGFSVYSAAEAESKCAEHLVRWRQLLERHRDEVEVTLKVPAVSPKARPDRRDFTTGAEYLRALHGATNATAVDENFRAAVARELVPRTVAHRWLHRDATSLELVALIRRDRLDELRAAGEALKETNVPFLLSGPWPLEVFADADRE